MKSTAVITVLYTNREGDNLATPTWYTNWDMTARSIGSVYALGGQRCPDLESQYAPAAWLVFELPTGEFYWFIHDTFQSVDELHKCS